MSDITTSDYLIKANTNGVYRKAVVWDMDGVILDSETIWINEIERKYFTELTNERVYEIFKHYITGSTLTKVYYWAIRAWALDAILTRFNIDYEPSIDLETYIKLSTVWPISIDQFLMENDFVLTEEEFKNDFINKGAELVYARAELTPGIIELFTYLKHEGFGLALVTSSPKEWIWGTFQNLAQHGFDALNSFDTIISGANISRSKPDPFTYDEAIAQLGVEKSQVFGFEDSNSGTRALRASLGEEGLSIQVRRNVEPGYRVADVSMYINDFRAIIHFIKWAKYLKHETITKPEQSIENLELTGLVGILDYIPSPEVLDEIFQRSPEKIIFRHQADIFKFASFFAE